MLFDLKHVFPIQWILLESFIAKTDCHSLFYRKPSKVLTTIRTPSFQSVHNTIEQVAICSHLFVLLSLVPFLVRHIHLQCFTISETILLSMIFSIINFLICYICLVVKFLGCFSFVVLNLALQHLLMFDSDICWP